MKPTNRLQASRLLLKEYLQTDLKYPKEVDLGEGTTYK